jgi:hypothetical protein
VWWTDLLWRFWDGLTGWIVPERRRFGMRCIGASERRRGHDVVRNCITPPEHRAANPRREARGQKSVFRSWAYRCEPSVKSFICGICRD